MLLAPSEAEGFGLSLIEAARHKLPIIARDIRVFREVAGENAFYFSGDAPEAIASAIDRWLSLYRQNKHPKSDSLRWVTWEQSAKRLQEIVLGDESYIAIPTRYDKSCKPGDGAVRIASKNLPIP